MRILSNLWAASATAWIGSAEELRSRVPICPPTSTNLYDG
jgi:hypothetical protein